MDLQGKVAIVTGGGTGIGRSCSLLLAKAGATVVVNYSRSEADANATVAEVHAAGGEAMAVKADLNYTTEIHKLVDSVVAQLGRVDVLINNAARTAFIPFADLDAMDEPTWDQIMDLNVKSPFLLCKAVSVPMRQAGAGAIVSIASIAGIKAGGSCIAYAVSKAALIHLTKCMALSLGPQIRVNAVSPGLVRTRWGERFTEEQKRSMESRSPLQASVTPDQIATAVMECVTNDVMTGHNIVVDAGLLLV